MAEVQPKKEELEDRITKLSSNQIQKLLLTLKRKSPVPKLEDASVVSGITRQKFKINGAANCTLEKTVKREPHKRKKKIIKKNYYQKQKYPNQEEEKFLYEGR